MSPGDFPSLDNGNGGSSLLTASTGISAQKTGRKLADQSINQAFPFRLLLFTTICILVADAVVAVLVASLPPGSPIYEKLIDAVITTAFIFPVLYFALFRPIQKYTQMLEQSQQELGKALSELEQNRAELEQRVVARTQDLDRVNQALLAENQSRQRAEDDLRKRNRELQALQEASLSLTQSLDVQTVLQNILDRIQQNFQIDGAILYLVSDPAHLSVHAYRGDQYTELEGHQLPFAIKPDDYPLLKRVLDSRQAVLVPDILAEPDWKPFFGKTSTRCWLGVPIFGGEHVIGIGALGNSQPGTFTESDIRFAAGLAGQAAVAVHNAWLFDQVRAGRERLRALSHRLVEAQEKERRYVARELHDETSQALVYLKMSLELLKSDIADPEKANQAIVELERIVEDVLDNIHRLTADLRPASLDHLGLAPALRQLVENLTQKYPLQVNLQIDNPEERLPAEVEISLYRIVQESLTNVLRHAKASRADVHIYTDRGKLITRIVDDGIGFNWDEAISKERLGLLGMRERAEMLGGSLMVETALGCGTQLLIEVPYVNPNPYR
jgi:signal transduction histidine kinase